MRGTQLAEIDLFRVTDGNGIPANVAESAGENARIPGRCHRWEKIPG